MEYWDKKNEIIKRCWAVNNAVNVAGADKKKIKKWYQFFYDWHSEWDVEMTEPEPKEIEYKGETIKPWEAESLKDDEIQEAGQAEKDKEKEFI